MHEDESIKITVTIRMKREDDFKQLQHGLVVGARWAGLTIAACCLTGTFTLAQPSLAFTVKGLEKMEHPVNRKVQIGRQTVTEF